MTPSFLEVYEISSNVCDSLVELWKTSDKKSPGTTIDGVMLDIKDSIDVILNRDTSKLNEYNILLQQCIDRYIEKYSYCNYYAPFRIIEGVNIQYYAPGGGYKAWHTERISDTYPVSSRHLVFMTYLNTIDEEGYEGGTEWFYQEKKIKAVKGKTVIWPADWTFTHRGIVSPVSEKYIITGWFSFLK